MSARPLKVPKVLIFCLDGAEPEVFRRLEGEGKIPHLAGLKREGTFSELITTIPSISPIVWSSFATGKNPGKHGILDIFTKKPNSYNLMLCMHRAREDGDGILTYEKMREGEAFWEILGEKGFRSLVFHLPATFPPDEFNGLMISGMGITDLRGTFGITSLYTTDETRKSTHGVEIKTLKREPGGKAFLSDVEGPKGIRIPLYFFPSEGGIVISFENAPEKGFTIPRRAWSPWVTVKFPVSPTRTVEGVTQFKLVELDGEDFTVLRIPVQPSPHAPLTPYTHPASLAEDLAETFGHYKILDRTEEGLDEETFLEDLYERLESKFEITKHYIRKEKWDVLITYVHTLDNIQHIMWKYYDPKSPHYDPGGARLYGDVIDDAYRRVDEKVGEVLRMLEPDTLVIALSDHGTTCIHKTFHPNSWLWQEGFLKTLSDGEVATPRGVTFHARSPGSKPIDWANTQASWYGRGLFLNVERREPQGIVKRGRNYLELRGALAESLSQVEDPDTGEKIFKKVLFREEIWSGGFLERLPDVVPLLREGYTLGWEDVHGEVDVNLPVIHPFNGAWVASHQGPYDPKDMAGILIVRGPGVKKGLELSDVNVMDLAPTILKLYGVEPLPDMDGRVLEEAFEESA